MASLSKDSIKKFVREYTNAEITNDGAEIMAKILEKKAREIANFAVKNAKKAKRNKVTKEDVELYIFKKDEKV